jgi:hypothetical protein
MHARTHTCPHTSPHIHTRAHVHARPHTNRSTSVGVTVSPVRVESIEKFGSLEAVGRRLLETEAQKARPPRFPTPPQPIRANFASPSTQCLRPRLCPILSFACWLRRTFLCCTSPTRAFLPGVPGCRAAPLSMAVYPLLPPCLKPRGPTSSFQVFQHYPSRAAPRPCVPAGEHPRCPAALRVAAHRRRRRAAVRLRVRAEQHAGTQAHCQHSQHHRWVGRRLSRARAAAACLSVPVNGRHHRCIGRSLSRACLLSALGAPCCK